MSSSTKSKSKDKRTGKEAQKASPKPAMAVNGNSSIATSAYNPLLGTFQVLDSVSIGSVPPLHYGRFRSIDEVDVNGIESDFVSNNGSCSGESEDHKEKTNYLPLKQEVIPGADNDNPCELACRSSCQVDLSPQTLYLTINITDRFLSQLMDCAKLLAFIHSRAAENTLRGVYKKYSKLGRGAVALISPAKSLLSAAP